MSKYLSKIVRPCKTDCGWTYCKIVFDGGRLSITGVEGPTADGDSKGACGQINYYLRDLVKYGDGWNKNNLAEFLNIWERWHLNDMRAGTPKKNECVRNSGKGWDYYVACQTLKDAGLLMDSGYRYATKWLREEVPDEVIEWLENLPDSPDEPAWV